MLLYILRRIVSAISVVVVTLVASFALFFLAPTDPAGVICGPRCTPERLADIESSLDLDEPALAQIGLYMKGIVVGRDYTHRRHRRHCSAPCMGYSYTLGQPVTKLLAQALPVTVSIVLGGAVVYLSVGVLAGTIAAQVRGTPLDRITVGATLVSTRALLRGRAAGRAVRHVPAESGYHPFLENPLTWATGLLAAWLTLGLTNAASYTRYSRASMIESLGQDFVRTARSKGISRRRVVYRHGLRAALTPVATIFGIDLALPADRRDLHREHLRAARDRPAHPARLRPVRPAGADGRRAGRLGRAGPDEPGGGHRLHGPRPPGPARMIGAAVAKHEEGTA